MMGNFFFNISFWVNKTDQFFFSFSYKKKSFSYKKKVFINKKDNEKG
jgi:hypothetical protein